MWKEREQCDKFLHFGLQRSGTNYFEGLMYRNFEVWCRNKGSGIHWKHSLDMTPITDEFMYFVISKNPYTWIESIAYRNDMDYVSRQTLYSALDRDVPANMIIGKKKLNVINLAKTWNHFHKNWSDISPNEHVLLIRYEDMLQNRERIIMAISLYFNIPLRNKANEYKSRETSILDHTLDSNKIEYYTQSIPTHLTEEQLNAINSVLDKTVMNKIGYEYIR